MVCTMPPCAGQSAPPWSTLRFKSTTFGGWLATLSSNVRSFDQGFSFSAVAVTSGPPFFFWQFDYIYNYIYIYSLSINSISSFSKRETPGKANHIKLYLASWFQILHMVFFFTPLDASFEKMGWRRTPRPGHITWRFSMGDLPKQLVYSIYNGESMVNSGE